MLYKTLRVGDLYSFFDWLLSQREATEEEEGVVRNVRVLWVHIGNSIDSFTRELPAKSSMAR